MLSDYRRLTVDDIARDYAAIQPGTLLSAAEWAVTRIRRDKVTLQDPDRRGVFLRVTFSPASGAARGLEIGSRVGVRGEVVCNRRARLEEIARAVCSDVALDGERIELPGAPGTYPNPLRLYPDVLNQTLHGRVASVHGDLHPHNVLVNVLPGGLGRGWLIDFAQVERRHNVLDFIALETYLRLWELGRADQPSLPLDEYLRFEEALNAATLGRSATPPTAPRLHQAYTVILGIRRIARNYMRRDSDFLEQYFPALFLYSLGMLQYYQSDGPQAARLVLSTAAALGQCIQDESQARPKTPAARPAAGKKRRESGRAKPPARGTAKPRSARQATPAGDGAVGRTASAPQSTPGQGTSPAWDTAAIRDLLVTALDDEELDDLCADYFRPIYGTFSSGMSKRQKVRRLLDYCVRYEQVDALLRLVEQRNPVQYARFAPRLGQEPLVSPQRLKGDGEPSAPASPLGTGNRWAVLVGVNEYEDETHYGRLHVCVKDAHAIRERLTASGFDPARVRLLTDDAEEKPLRNRILAALQAVAGATEPDDLLLFYYSGHGDEDAGESYLVAQDGERLTLGDTAVRVARVKQIMEDAPARAKVIILDACHSGADIGGKGPRPMSEAFIRRVFEEARGLAILASCTQGELSYEWRAQERSVFTHYMLEALAGQADRDEKGCVTVQDAHRHVTDGVKLWASQRDTRQTPTLQCAVAGDIILVRRSSAGVNPFVFGPAVPPERFYGRRTQMADVKNRIGAITAQCISIVGHRRSGKSSLLRYIRERPHEFCRPEQQPLIVSLDLQEGEFRTPAGVREGLRRGIQHATGDSPWPREANDDPFTVKEGLTALRDGGRRLIVLLDEFECIGERLEQFQGWGEDCRAKASDGLFALVIASKRPLEQVYTSLGLSSPFGNIFSVTLLGALEEEAWRRLVADGFARSGQTLIPAYLDLMDDLAGGLPFYTQMAASLLWQHADLTRARDEFAFQAAARFQELWDDLTPPEQHALRVAAGQGGLAAPDPEATKDLRRHGLLRPDGRPFSSAFAEFVRGRR